MFLFDEPLSNLDAALRVKMRIEIAKLHKELSSTIIYVTHDQVEAMTLANRIVVLSPLKGEAATNLEQFGTRSSSTTTRTTSSWRASSAPQDELPGGRAGGDRRAGERGQADLGRQPCGCQVDARHAAVGAWGGAGHSSSTWCRWAAMPIPTAR